MALARSRAKLIDRGHEVIGIDISPAMLDRARKAVPGGTFLLADVTGIPLSDRDVDHVVCALALTHVPDLGPVFAEAARIMRPGGHLLVLDTRTHFTGSGKYPLIQHAPDGRVGYVAGYNHGFGEYLRSALLHSFVVRACEETYRDDQIVAPDEFPEPLTPGSTGHLGTPFLGARGSQRC